MVCNFSEISDALCAIAYGKKSHLGGGHKQVKQKLPVTVKDIAQLAKLLGHQK